jgi:predicted AAA+ superfamily ATPase
MDAKRELASYIKEISKIYPVLGILGPRQSGKTTLVKELFNKKPYINLEKPKDRDFALEDPELFLNQFPDGAIIDEIQYAPNLFSYIQVIVDEQKQKSMFVLTGSQNFALMKNISQSLAGRIGLATLLPFSLVEIEKNYKDVDVKNIEQLIYTGFYPKIYDEKANPRIILEDYIKTYLERDLRDWAQIQDLNLFRRFMKMCASRVGQVLNMSNIAEDLGLSHTTIKKWISLLEASYIIFLLPAFNANINKQLIKSPKLHFYDVGLAAHLLDIENPKQLISHSLRGNLFENFVVSELIKFRFNQGFTSNLYFYRDKRHEVDLLYKIADKLMPIEIKSGQSISEDYFKNLNYFTDLFPENSINPTLVYAASDEQKRSKALVTNTLGLIKQLKGVS